MKIEIDQSEVVHILKEHNENNPLLKLILSKLEKVMATQAELAAALKTANDALTAIATEVDKVGTEVDTLNAAINNLTAIISAGQAALIVEVRDSNTNALLGRVADRRATQNLGRQIASTATNVYDFRLLFDLWAGICTKALGELKSLSPVPRNLKPNQRL